MYQIGVYTCLIQVVDYLVESANYVTTDSMSLRDFTTCVSLKHIMTSYSHPF